jgi:hypothetical protein
VELPVPGEVRLSFGSNTKKTKASDITKKRIIVRPNKEFLRLFDEMEFIIED